MTNFPTTAIISVTMLCNSRCIMCSIWKNNKKDGFDNNVYRKLPSSLTMIDITGGEPFVRNDLAEVVAILKETAPKAQLLITTNGYLVEKIKRDLPSILQADPNIAFRVSLDGWGQTHDDIRRLPHFFDRVIQTIELLKSAKVKDIGIIFTLMNKNAGQTKRVLEYCKANNLNMSFNIVHESPIYFGKGQLSLRPSIADTRKEINQVIKYHLSQLHPKNWAKAWFYQKQSQYIEKKQRPLPCGAGENLFYLDPFGTVYMCHFKSWRLGNLITQSFNEIWNSPIKQTYLTKAAGCHDCWIMCTAKDAIKKNKITVLKDLMVGQFTSLLNG